MDNSRIKYWLDCAEYDFQTAKVMLEGKRYLYVGFMCHQVIEKSLKAFYSSHNNDMPPYIHGLVKLGIETGLYNGFSEEQKSIIDILEPLNIEARYPSQKEDLLKSLSPERCREIINKTGELYQWIKNRLSE
ncbi:MAG: HEPN domain-containing protein [Spirochaetales bacterium]|nr:HEPN domain-containing protein [Spirochaetales bacterium]